MTLPLLLAAAFTNLTGVVTFERSGLPFYFIEASDGSNWRVERTASTNAVVGDVIEAWGEREPSAVKNRLATKGLKVLSHGEAPLPQEVEIPEIFAGIMPYGDTRWYGGLFATEGLLRDINRRQNSTQLLVGDGEYNLQVEIPIPLEDPLPDKLVQGATVRIVGSLAYTSIENYDESVFGRIENVELLPTSSDAVEVVKRAPKPPFWTGRRVAGILGILGLVVFVLFVWAATLRRMVRKRTDELAESIRERETVRIEADAARRERLRLAADLHDGFQQYLASAMFRLKAARNYLPKEATRSAEQLAEVQAALQHTQTGLRSTLWAMNEESEGPESLMALFGFAARRMAHWDGKVEIAAEGEERAIARKSAGTLLLIMQEAVGNALKHGRAAHVRVRLVFSDSRLVMSVVDDGIGFDSERVMESGHYGMASMERRCSELGGAMTVWSKRGLGSRIDFSLPLE